MDATRPAGGPVPLANVARGKPARQSSVYAGARFQDPEADARGAVDGTVSGGYGFHTAEESSPWWQVDLGAPHLLSEVVVYNRVDQPDCRARALPLEIALSDDGAAWRLVHVQHEGFGGADGEPLRWTAARREQARFVKLTVPRLTYLHLDEVEVYGRAFDPLAGAEAAGEASAPFIDRLRRTLPEERGLEERGFEE